MRAARRLAIAAVALAACARPARAAPSTARPDPRAISARIACDSGQPDRGVALLAQIAAENGDDNALFNQARCYQQNGRTREALQHFKEYQRRARELSIAELRQVDSYIHELEQELARGNPTPQPPPLQPGAPAAADHASDQLAAQPGPRPRRDTRLAAAVVGGVGALALGAGVYFSLKVRSLSNDLGSPSPPITASELRDKTNAGNDAARYQWIGYGVAAAALTGAAALLWLHQPAPAATPTARATLLPALAPGSAGAQLRLRF